MSINVLVVDDEPAALEYICGIIEKKCPELVVAATASDGKEGLARFRECMPDLIISDVKMPVLDGLDILICQIFLTLEVFTDNPLRECIYHLSHLKIDQS